MSDAIERIAGKLEELTKRDRSHTCFGSENHEYRLGPPMTEAAIRDGEAHYGIELPVSYREFLLRIGNGGAGPGYGLQRFGWVSNTDEIPTAARRGELVTVSRHGGITIQRPRLYDREGREIDHFDVSFYDLMRELAGEGASCPAQPFPLSAPAEDPDWDALDVGAGSLPLADYGCAIVGRLVLGAASTPFAGQIWVLDGSAGPFMPFAFYANLHDPDAEIDGTREFTFLDWYEHWLEASIAQL